MRVSASGPNCSWFGASDFHVPRPRLQSMRATALPSGWNVIVYFERSSGSSVVPSLPENFTSCHEVPASEAVGAAGVVGSADFSTGGDAATGGGALGWQPAIAAPASTRAVIQDSRAIIGQSSLR